MRILLLGGHGLARPLQDLWDGFQMLGADCSYLPYMGEREQPDVLKRTLEAGNYTAVIGFCMYYACEESLDLLEQSSAYKLMWQFDSPHREIDSPELLAQQLRGWDASLCSSAGPYVEDFFRRLGKPFYSLFPPPVALNPDMSDNDMWNTASAYTTTFIGQPHTDPGLSRTICTRPDLVESVEQAFGPEAVGVFGRGWEQERPVLDWHECLYYWAAPTSTLGHHGEKDDRHYLNGRDTRAMGAGACYVCDRANELDTLLEDGHHCFFYDSPKHAVDIIRSIVAEEDGFRSVREAGQKFVTEHWSQDKMAQNIIDIIEDQTGVPFQPQADSGRDPVVRYSTMTIDAETEGPNDLSGLWADSLAGYVQTVPTVGQAMDYELGPVPEPARGRAGLRVLVRDRPGTLVGHAALVNRELAGLDVGGLCGTAVLPAWWTTGVPGRLLEVVKQAGRAAGYEALVGYIPADQRDLFRQCGYSVHSRHNIALYVYNRDLPLQSLWDAAVACEERW